MQNAKIYARGCRYDSNLQQELNNLEGVMVQNLKTAQSTINPNPTKLLPNYKMPQKKSLITILEGKKVPTHYESTTNNNAPYNNKFRVKPLRFALNTKLGRTNSSSNNNDVTPGNNSNVNVKRTDEGFGFGNNLSPVVQPDSQKNEGDWGFGNLQPVVQQVENPVLQTNEYFGFGNNNLPPVENPVSQKNKDFGQFLLCTVTLKPNDKGTGKYLEFCNKRYNDIPDYSKPLPEKYKPLPEKETHIYKIEDKYYSYNTVTNSFNLIPELKNDELNKKKMDLIKKLLEVNDKQFVNAKKGKEYNNIDLLKLPFLQASIFKSNNTDLTPSFYKFNETENKLVKIDVDNFNCDSKSGVSGVSNPEYGLQTRKSGVTDYLDVSKNKTRMQAQQLRGDKEYLDVSNTKHGLQKEQIGRREYFDVSSTESELPEYFVIDLNLNKEENKVLFSICRNSLELNPESYEFLPKYETINNSNIPYIYNIQDVYQFDENATILFYNGEKFEVIEEISFDEIKSNNNKFSYTFRNKQGKKINITSLTKQIYLFVNYNAPLTNIYYGKIVDNKIQKIKTFVKHIDNKFCNQLTKLNTNTSNVPIKHSTHPYGVIPPRNSPSLYNTPPLNVNSNPKFSKSNKPGLKITNNKNGVPDFALIEIGGMKDYKQADKKILNFTLCKTQTQSQLFNTSEESMNKELPKTIKIKGVDVPIIYIIQESYGEDTNVEYYTIKFYNKATKKFELVEDITKTKDKNNEYTDSSGKPLIYNDLNKRVYRVEDSNIKKGSSMNTYENRYKFLTFSYSEQKFEDLKIEVLGLNKTECNNLFSKK